MNPDKTRFRDYCNLVSFELNTPARIRGNVMERLVDDEWITQKEFEKIYPVALRSLSKSFENPCNKYKYLNT